MTTYTIQFSREARDAIQAHVDYVAADLRSPENADRWLARLLEVIDSLTTMPARFAVDEARSALAGVRIHRLTFERSCVLLYIVDESAARVHVLSFHHGGLP